MIFQPHLEHDKNVNKPYVHIILYQTLVYLFSQLLGE